MIVFIPVQPGVRPDDGEWVIASYVDHYGDRMYDCGTYDAIHDTMETDLQEANCSTPFEEYEKYALIENEE